MSESESGSGQNFNALVNSMKSEGEARSVLNWNKPVDTSEAPSSRAMGEAALKEVMDKAQADRQVAVGNREGNKQ